MDFVAAFLLLVLIGEIVFTGIGLYISSKTENRKENKRSSILFNANLKEKECYRYPEEIFETLEEKGIKLNYLGNKTNP